MKQWDTDDPNHPMRVLPKPEDSSASDGETQLFDPMADDGDEAAFDYGAFEADQDDLAHGQAAQDASQASNSPAAPTVRTTVPRFAHTDNATHSVRPAGRFLFVTIEGRINEAFDGAALGTQLQGCATIFDLSEVDRITSFGVRGWLKMMETAGLHEAYFVSCSESVINQITMIHHFCGPARVHSLVAPYLCGACGAEFGVPMHAIADADLLKGRQAPHVACPECSSVAELDEDPWAFFDLDRDLLTEEVPDLTRVLDHVRDDHRKPPVEKSIAGSTTRVRFNGVLDGTSRIRRAMSGLEGVVSVDLTRLEQATPEGWDLLMGTCRNILGEVEQLRFEGVDIDLGSRLLASDFDDRVRMTSLAMQATNAHGVRRKALIEVNLNLEALSGQRGPRVDAAWASGGIVLEAAGLAADLVKRFPPPPPEATPAPAPYAASAATATPAPVVVPPSPVPASGPSTNLVLAAASLLILVAMGVGGAALLISLNGQRQAAPQAAAPATAPAPIAPAPVDGEWSTGGFAPPSWAATPVQQTATHLTIVGTGTGTTLELATASAERAALTQLAHYTRAQLSVTPSGPGLDAFPIPDSVELAERLRAHPVPLPTLQTGQAATRTLAGNHEATLQFLLASDQVAAFVAEQSVVVDFRGLLLAPTPAWAAPGTRLVSSPSWWQVDQGAVLSSIAGASPPPTGQVPSVGQKAYDAVPAGQDLQLVFQAATGPQTVRMAKQESAAPRKPQLMKLGTK